MPETPEDFTLAGEVKNSSDTTFAGEDVDGVLALVLVRGLVDFQPQLLPCDSTLHSVRVRNLAISERPQMRRSQKALLGLPIKLIQLKKLLLINNTC